MIFQRTNPVGIDKVISQIQTELFNTLTTQYGWDANEYNSFDRAYKNVRNLSSIATLIPEMFQDGSVEDDYSEAYFDDKVYASSFFLVDDNIPVTNGVAQASASVIFQLDLSLVYPTITHRADEEAHRHVYLALEKMTNSLDISAVVTGVPNVYSGLNIEQVLESDIHPCHVFRINFDLDYIYSCR